MFERYLKPLTLKIKAFTLIEVLVVISILALLMSVLFPALNRAREQANRAVCLANLRSIGQCLYLYSNNNEGKLVAGDTWSAWDAWGLTSEPAGCESSYKQVNLGYLLTSDLLDIPTDDKHVFFCPAGSAPDGGQASERFLQGWGQNQPAPIGYMFNNSLDGFDDFVQDGDCGVLSHKNKINFLRVDGSAHTFHVKRLVYDASVGPELLQEVCTRYGVCFPTIMLHRWLEQGAIDLDEAKQYLGNPQGWAMANSTKLTGKPVLLAHLGNESLVCDVVGVWGDAPGPGPPPPPPG